MIGATLGDHKILELLGTGGRGEVALEVLPAELSSDPDRLACFEREVKA